LANKIRVGNLVNLKENAIGYAPPLDDLGTGLVLEIGAREFEATTSHMVKVLWTKTNEKRWEFLVDLVLVENK